MHAHEYADLLKEQRKAKDDFFRSHSQSPVSDTERPGFDGLRYFPPDPKFAVRAVWEPATAPKVVRMGTSTGEMQDYVEAGTLRFSLDGKDVSLKGFRNAAHPHGDLFVPFRDATSGKETYGAARYLEVAEPEHGETVVDFNQAYNPYCAYNEAYTCPLPPRENWLNVAVRAGEKVFKEE